MSDERKSKGAKMEKIAKELYAALKEMIASDGDFSHCETKGYFDCMMIGSEFDIALDLLVKYKDLFGKDKEGNKKESKIRRSLVLAEELLSLYNMDLDHEDALDPFVENIAKIIEQFIPESKN